MFPPTSDHYEVFFSILASDIRIFLGWLIIFYCLPWLYIYVYAYLVFCIMFLKFAQKFTLLVCCPIQEGYYAIVCPFECLETYFSVRLKYDWFYFIWNCSGRWMLLSHLRVMNNFFIQLGICRVSFRINQLKISGKLLFHLYDFVC